MSNPESCDFCGIADRPELPFDITEPMDPEGDLILKPSLGMLVPGHFLVIPCHVTSFAQFPPETLRRYEKEIDRYTEFLSKKFGPYIWIEHGSDNLKNRGSGACIEHAHLHLVPALCALPDVRNDLGEHIQSQLSLERLSGFEDIARFRGEPYFYLRRYLGGVAMGGRVDSRERVDYIVPNPQIPGQYTQRQVAEGVGIDVADSDWAIHDSRQEVLQTLCTLGFTPGFIWYFNRKTRTFEVRQTKDNPEFDAVDVLKGWRIGVGVPETPGSPAEVRSAVQKTRLEPSAWHRFLLNSQDDADPWRTQ